MWNPFKHKRNNKKQLRELNLLSTQFAILDEFARRGLLYWKEGEKMLLIEQSIAILKMTEGASGFQHFLDQVGAWQNYKLINAAYENRRIEIETSAVRKAQKDNKNLTKADIYRIRQLARQTMPEIQLKDLQCIKEFDILVISATAVSAKEATEESEQLVAVGHYNGERIEMAMYDDIKHNLQTTIE